MKSRNLEDIWDVVQMRIKGVPIGHVAKFFDVRPQQVIRWEQLFHQRAKACFVGSEYNILADVEESIAKMEEELTVLKHAVRKLREKHADSTEGEQRGQYLPPNSPDVT